MKEHEDRKTTGPLVAKMHCVKCGGVYNQLTPDEPLCANCRRGTLRKLTKKDLVKAWQCCCGMVLPPNQRFQHEIECRATQVTQKKLVEIPNPTLFIVQSSRGPLAIEGLETAEELLAQFGPVPFSPVK